MNNDDGTGTDPSFAVDDISLMQNPNGIATIDPATINVFAANGQITINSNGQAYKMLGVNDMLGREVKFTQVDNHLQLGETESGIYIVNMEINGQRIMKKVMLNQ